MGYPQFNYRLGEPMPRPKDMPPLNKVVELRPSKQRPKTQSGVPAIPLKKDSEQ